MSEATAIPFTTPLRTSDGLRRLRWLSFRNDLILKFTRSRFRSMLVVIFSIVFWIGLYFLFMDAFGFLYRHRLISGYLVELLFGLFFGSLLVMLVFSAGIILFAGLFASEESRYLLISPVPPDMIFAYKFQESMVFSCWGFVLLGSPLMIAYGVITHAPLMFYVLSLPFFVSFALIPGSVGALICLFVTLLMPRRKKEVLAALILFVIVIVAIIGVRAWYLIETQPISRAWLHRLMTGLQVSNLPFLPSHWISRGLLAATDVNGLSVSFFYLLVLLANAFFVHLVTAASYSQFYRHAYDRNASYPVGRRRPRSRWLPKAVDTIFFPLNKAIRVMILKDIRIFVRDPVQWLQVLVFTCLLILYLVTLGRMNHYTESPYWRNLISFFNLSVTALIVSTFTSRFIFPQLSLEGQRIWILGLAPIKRDAVLWGKFAFASGGAIMVTVLLTIISALMLKIGWLLFCLHLFTNLILCFGISGIAVGLGARFPELNQSDPSKIAAGFGGTLNLVTSLLFILVVVTIMVLPCYLYAITLSIEQGHAALDFAEGADPAGLSLSEFQFWLAVSIVSTLGIGVFATLFPLKVGMKAFREMEF
ncbi:hypothetical protein Pan216_53190 [Planctomycetes bacterium Pan216]|uniref:Uncharacterized protein n=1 Tax=Kolteria novifilia TaxID=2527975 RepID=A0A518BBT5_9BACT|nr:hypothetical protein Pan216_53190 [Planctomycetes bacterium Pan216]